jgi:hypothetical protein
LALTGLEGAMPVAKVLGDPVLFDRTSNMGTVQFRDSDVGRIMKSARLGASIGTLRSTSAL